MSADEVGLRHRDRDQHQSANAVGSSAFFPRKRDQDVLEQPEMAPALMRDLTFASFVRLSEGPPWQGRRPGRRGPVSNGLEEWVPRVYRFALRLSNDAHVAEDLTQETFLRAWRQRERLRDPGAVRVWLFRITANLWRDNLRRGRSAVARAGPLEDTQPGPEMSADRRASGQEDLARALEAMADLPPRQREVLYLVACEGLTVAKVAAVLDLSPEAAKANLSLARKKMRQQLDDLFPDPAQAT